MNSAIIRHFEEIKNSFLKKTILPQKDNWKERSNEEIWQLFIGQVIAVGRSEPAHVFSRVPQYQKRISFERLSGMIRDQDMLENIHSVLRDVGTRYCCQDVSKCLKSKSLVKNFKKLREFDDGPKGMLAHISNFTGADCELKKIKYLMNEFAYMKSKSSRDFLMDNGIVQQAIAFDTRLQNVLNKLGIEVPEKIESNVSIYDRFEKQILTEICIPLNIKGYEFDRLIYQHYDLIMGK